MQRTDISKIDFNSCDYVFQSKYITIYFTLNARYRSVNRFLSR